MKKIKFKAKEGFALYFLLLFVVIFSIFAITLFNGILTNIKLSGNIASYKKAFYSADAGITYGRFLLKKMEGIPKKLPDGQKYIPGDPYQKKDLYGNGSFQIIFKEIKDSEKRYIIESKSLISSCICEIKAIIDINGKVKDYKILN